MRDARLRKPERGAPRSLGSVVAAKRYQSTSPDDATVSVSQSSEGDEAASSQLGLVSRARMCDGASATKLRLA